MHYTMLMYLFSTSVARKVQFILFALHTHFHINTVLFELTFAIHSAHKPIKVSGICNWSFSFK